MITISNAVYTAKIAPHGAELKSLIRHTDGKEFIWQGDARFWEDSSPMLFPICGRLNGNRYTFEGQTYEMLLHGFLQTMDPAETHVSESAVDLVFCETAETLAQYPFRFVLTVHFALTDCGLRCEVTVGNRDEKTMYYAVGAHPGFSLPLGDGATLDDHYLRFPEAKEVKKAVIDDNGFFTGELVPYALEANGEIRLSEEQFRIDGIFLSGVGGLCELHCDGATDYVRVVCPQNDVTGTWKEYGAEAKFLCLEPWCGYPSIAGVPDVLDRKFGMYALAPKAESTFAYDIEICRENA